MTVLTKFSIHCLTFILITLSPLSAQALEPDEIVVVANSQESDGVQLAKFYMKQRNIPDKNLLIIATAANEGINRDYYDDEIASPIRSFLKNKPEISCLVLLYGIPIRINGHLQPIENQSQEQHNNNRQQRDPVASVDSELSLVKVENYPVMSWIPNPYFLSFQQEATTYQKGQVLMVSRLDGPDPATVKRIITDSLTVEKTGLTGTAYFDARWPKPKDSTHLQGYALYDNAIHEAATGAKEVMPVVLNQKDALFQPGEAPHAAFYCGWYSLSHYIDAFDWQQGAVAYHIASGECTTLKKKGSQVWCKRLLEDGVAATIGPVGEPYVQAFPFPQIFFGLLLDGDFTLAEAYYLSLPYISWKMILIGDPLYQPLRHRGIVP